MTTKHSFRPCKPTALGRRFRITVSALALSALIGLGAGVSQSQAAIGSVYFDTNDNAAAGENPLQRDLHRLRQRRPGPLVMPTSPPAPTTSPPAARRAASPTQAAMATSPPAPYADSNTTGSDNVATGHSALISNTPATTTSPPAPGDVLQQTGNNNVATG